MISKESILEAADTNPAKFSPKIKKAIKAKFGVVGKVELIRTAGKDYVKATGKVETNPHYSVESTMNAELIKELNRHSGVKKWRKEHNKVETKEFQGSVMATLEEWKLMLNM